MVNVLSPQFLVLSEIFYPEGWEITSHPDWEIQQVNTVLRGIAIPQGNYSIIMEFIPNDIKYGAMITWTSTLILCLCIILGKIRDNSILIDRS